MSTEGQSGQLIFPNGPAREKHWSVIKKGYITVVICTDCTWASQKQVGMGGVIASGSLGNVMVSMLIIYIYIIYCFRPDPSPYSRC